MIKFLRNPSSIYLLLWCLYNLQGVLYASGGSISQGLLVVLYVISLVVIVKNHSSISQNQFFKALNLIVIMFTIYGLISVVMYGSVVHNVPATEYFKRSYNSLLPIYVCYVYTKRGYLNIKTMQIWMVIMLVVGISFFYRTQGINLARLDQGEETTNNASYILLSLIPGMMVFYKKPVYLYIGVGICTIFVLMGMKRGAILINAIALAMMVVFLMKSSKGSYKILTFLAIVIGVVFLSRAVENMLATSAFFNQRVQQTVDGDSSRRDVLYKGLWDVFTNKSDLFNQVFGHGAWGTRKTLHTEAHNDWLQILIDNGILGIIIFVYYWICFYRESRNRKRTQMSRFCLLLFFVVFFTKTLFSMSIMSMPIYATSFLGFCLADGFAYKIVKIKKVKLNDENTSIYR